MNGGLNEIELIKSTFFNPKYFESVTQLKSDNKIEALTPAGN